MADNLAYQAKRKRTAPLIATIAFLSMFLPQKAQTQDYDKTLDLPVEKAGLESMLKPPIPPEEQGEDKPPMFYGQEIKSENNTIYYVIDVSGSMEMPVTEFLNEKGEVVKGGNRLDRAKVELIKSISTLPPNFRFNAVGYDDILYKWRDVKKLYEADDETKASAITWAGGLIPWGCTGTAMAVGVALEVKENKLVLLLTDGAPNSTAIRYSGNAGPDIHRADIKWANYERPPAPHAVINVYGIDAQGDFKKFCMDVATDNGGTYTDVR